MRVILILLLLSLSAHAQSISYFNQGLLRQPSAEADRNYLGVYGSNITGWGTSPSTPFVKVAGDYMTGSLTNTSLVSIRGSGTYARLSFEVQDPGFPGVWLASAIDFLNTGVMTFMPDSVFNGRISQDLIVGVHQAGIDGTGMFFGNGAGLTNIPSAGLPSWVAYTTSNQTFTGINTFTNTSGTNQGLLIGKNGTNFFLKAWTGPSVALGNTTGNAGFMVSNSVVHMANVIGLGSSSSVSYNGGITTDSGVNAFGGFYGVLIGSANKHIRSTGNGCSLEFTNSAGRLFYNGTNGTFSIGTNSTFVVGNSGGATGTGFTNTTVTGVGRAFDMTATTNAYEDLPYPITSLNPAAGKLVENSGQSGDQLAFRMSANDYFYVSPQMQHYWTAGTTVYPHFHLEPQTANTNTLTWEVRHSIADINGVFPVDTVITNQIGIPSNKQWTHLLFSVPTNGISMSGKTGPSTAIRMRIKLLAATESIDMIYFDVHIRYGGSPVIYSP